MNITIRPTYGIYTILPTKEKTGAVGLIYVCRTHSDEVTLSHEHTEYLWATKAQLKELMYESAVKDYTENNVFEILPID